MLTALMILVCIGAGTVGGVFFAFSTFVMKALSQLPVSHGIAAMQRINIVVLNPYFLGVFLGTALLAAGCLVVSITGWGAPRSILLTVSGVLYLGGTFLVTMVFNVPRNEHLAVLESLSPEAKDYWITYQREWSFWNHVRSVSAVASAACSAGALTT